MGQVVVFRISPLCVIFSSISDSIQFLEDPLHHRVKANQEDYEKLSTDIFKAMNLVNETNPETTVIVSRYQLSQDSIDFNNYVRDFWTQGMPYTQSF